MKRRSMLRSFVVAAASGNILARTAKASVLRDPAELPALSETRARAARVIEISQRRNAARLAAASDTVTSTTDALHSEVDSLLAHLLSRYQSRIDQADIRAVFSNRQAALRDDNLRELANGVVPVAVFRELCREFRVDFNPRRLVNWPTFVDRYGSAILAA